MKIKSRKKRIEEYNKKYLDRIYDPEKCVREYFRSRKWNLEKASLKAAKKLSVIVSEREFETIHITLYEYPMKTDRPRSTKFGTIYSPNAADNHKYFEKAYKQVCKTLKLINTPAEIYVEAYLEMPKQVPPDEVILFEAKVLNPIDKPDYDNIGKCYTDMLTDVITSDDDLFYLGQIQKFYSVLPRVEITVTYLKCHESDFIYKKMKSRKHVKEAMKNGQLILKKLDYGGHNKCGAMKQR